MTQSTDPILEQQHHALALGLSELELKGEGHVYTRSELEEIFTKGFETGISTEAKQVEPEMARLALNLSEAQIHSNNILRNVRRSAHQS